MEKIITIDRDSTEERCHLCKIVGPNHKLSIPEKPVVVLCDSCLALTYEEARENREKTYQEDDTFKRLVQKLLTLQKEQNLDMRSALYLAGSLYLGVDHKIEACTKQLDFARQDMQRALRGGGGNHKMKQVESLNKKIFQLETKSKAFACMKSMINAELLHSINKMTPIGELLDFDEAVKLVDIDFLKAQANKQEASFWNKLKRIFQ